MKKKVLLLLENGFEEIETVTPVDLLRRSGVEVYIAGVTEEIVKGNNGIIIKSDGLLSSVDIKQFDLLLITGGGAVKKLISNHKVIEIVKNFYDSKKLIAAICAGPLLLKSANILDKHKVTSYPSEKCQFKENQYLDENVVISENIITSKGPATAYEFGIALIKLLQGQKIATEIASATLFE